jgi:hypothetical protein
MAVLRVAFGNSDRKTVEGNQEEGTKRLGGSKRSKRIKKKDVRMGLKWRNGRWEEELTETGRESRIQILHGILIPAELKEFPTIIKGLQMRGEAGR